MVSSPSRPIVAQIYNLINLLFFNISYKLSIVSKCYLTPIYNTPPEKCSKTQNISPEKCSNPLNTPLEKCNTPLKTPLEKCI